MAVRHDDSTVGILLAGGTGSRLFPLTKATNKHLLNVYDKPLIFYSLSLLMLAGLRDIIVVCRQEDLSSFQALLGNGRQWGVAFTYTIQDDPNGIAEVFLLTEQEIRHKKVVLVLGDNILHGSNLTAALKSVVRNNYGASILSYPVSNPTDFGVVELDSDGNVLSLEEKPALPKSNLAVPGFYCYDERVSAMAKQLKPSKRGELEITDLNLRYFEDGAIKAYNLGRGISWLDGGSPEGLFEASQYVRVMQIRTGLIIASPEEIAWTSGWINDEELELLCADGKASSYAETLLSSIPRKQEKD